MFTSFKESGNSWCQPITNVDFETEKSNTNRQSATLIKIML